MTPREAYIALNLTEKLGPVKVRALIEILGSPMAILEADEAELRKAKGVGPELSQSIVAQRDPDRVAREIERAEALGLRLVTPVDAEYPEPLKSIHDPPLALYVRGTLEPNDRHSVAVVGTRHSTHYGTQIADRLSFQMARTGIAVISGLARGIDTAAHRGALKGGGRTLAVLGSAHDQLYPPENADLAGQIAEQGAVLSEFPLGTAPGRTTFPMRNRIVSGLAAGVLVVEADTGSGAILTADEALAQGRTVFAVPGRIDSPGSRGCHRLIKQGATLVDDIDDILQEFEFLFPPERARPGDRTAEGPVVQLTDEEKVLASVLKEGALNLDDLARRTAFPAHRVNILLLQLEMKRIVRMLPGRQAELNLGVDWAE